MKVKLVWMIVALIVLGFVLYRSPSAKPRLKVEPHAAQEIEKAKGR